MAVGDWIGTPTESGSCWAVEFPDLRGSEYVHAERVTIDGGAAVFTNGDVFERKLIAIYAPGGYRSIFEVANCWHEAPDDDEDDDD